MTDEQRRMERGLLLVAIEEQQALVSDISKRNARLGEALEQAGSMLCRRQSNALPKPKREDLGDFFDLQKVRDYLAELSSAERRLLELQKRN